jgi:hypothetical protein
MHLLSPVMTAVSAATPPQRGRSYSALLSLAFVGKWRVTKRLLLSKTGCFSSRGGEQARAVAIGCELFMRQRE